MVALFLRSATHSSSSSSLLLLLFRIVLNRSIYRVGREQESRYPINIIVHRTMGKRVGYRQHSYYTFLGMSNCTWSRIAEGNRIDYCSEIVSLIRDALIVARLSRGCLCNIDSPASQRTKGQELCASGWKQ